MRRALLVLLLAACHPAQGTTTVRPTGLSGGRPVTPETAVDLAAWDVRVDAADTTRAHTDDRHVMIESASHGDLGKGVFTLWITVAEAQAKRGAWDLAQAIAEDWRASAKEVGGMGDIQFLGVPGIAFFVDTGDTSILEVVATKGPCVVRLTILRASPVEGLDTFAGETLRRLHTASGKPFDAPRCR